MAERLLRLLDQCEQVTHVEDAGGHPVRVEGVEVVQLLAVRREHDRLAGDRGDGERGTTAGVTVELRQDDAVEADAVAEGLGRVDRVLTDHRVDDEEDLVRGDDVADVRGLLHHLLVDAEAAGGVHDHDVVDLGLRELHGVLGDLDRVADAVARLGGVDGHTGALGDDAELAHGVRALEVGGDQEREWPWSLSHLPSFPASVVLPAPCRPASMITVGGFLANRRRRVSPPRIVTSSSFTIFRTCWAGLRALETSLPSALSFTFLMNVRTTGRATSASRSAIRISRAVASMSASESRPFPRRFLKVALRRSERVSNTVASVLGVGGGWVALQGICPKRVGGPCPV